MANIIVLATLLSMVAVPAILNIFAYPVSRRLSLKISDYIVKVCAPRVFSVLSCYKNFHFWGYKESTKDLPENFILISNHQSLIDIPVYMNFLRDKNLRFVAKSALGRHIPLVSEMLRSHQHCIVPRNAKPMEAMKVVGDFGERVVRLNQIPVLFPEGTRTKDGNIGKFYTAGFRKLTESSKLPVVVAVLDGGFQMRDLRKIFTRLENGCYRVKILKVFPCPETKDECNQVLDEAKALMQAQLDEWHKISSNVK